MNRFFYLKLALQNLKKNSKMIIPYFLTATLFSMMFYVILALSLHSEFYGRTRGVMLSLGVGVIGIFAFIFLFYTNSFVIKQRKSELGLYNILGMEKYHISRILFYETLLLALVSITAGICIGSLFGQGIFLLLVKMVGDLPTMNFEISFDSIKWTYLLFGIIFLCTALFNVSQIHLSKPIDLLRSKSEGEKEPKTKWILTILGIICLAAGYYIAITVKNPVDALLLFFVAVILVIFGTYFLFTAGSIALLKLMRKNKKYYYKTSHFVSVSNMIYRMKQNAVGLGNICILATMVLVMISSTGSLFIGVNDLIKREVSKDVEASFSSYYLEVNQAVDKNIMNYLHDLDMTDFTRNYSFSLALKLQDDTLIPKDEDQTDYSDYYYVYFSTDDSIDLGDHEIAVYFDDGTAPKNLTIGTQTYQIQYNSDSLENGSLDDMFNYNPGYKGLVYIIMKDEKAIDEMSKSIDLSHYGYVNWPQYNYAFNCDLSEDQFTKLQEDIYHIIHETTDQFDNLAYGYGYSVNFQAFVRQELMEFFGSFFFLGIFLSILFMIATTLIMYYKQISEGYDDVKRYEILQKVGMSHEEVKKSIHSQIMIVFFMPLITAGIHLMFAFNMIYQMFMAFGMTNKTMFASVMVIVYVIFSIFYFIIYQLTAKVYYKIVS